MAGLGLVNALDQYQQGVNFKQQQEEIARQKAERANLETANQAAGSVFEAEKAEHALSGANGPYQPSDTTRLRAAEARGQAFAKAGDWENFLKNEAMVHGQRVRVRSGALQRYEQDGDIEALARTVYPTVFDGKEIVSAEKIEGADAVAGLPALPSKIKFKLSDGSEKSFEPQKIVSMVKQSLVDPARAYEMEIQQNFLRTKADIEAGGKIRVEAAKGDQARKTAEVTGDQARKTEAVRGDQARATEGVKADYSMNLAKFNNMAAQQRANTSAGATLGAARIDAENRLAVAGLEGASRERVAGMAGKGDGNGLGNAQKWTDLAKTHFGKIAGGPMGSSRIAGQATLDLGMTAEKIHKANPGMTEQQALNEAAKFLKLESPKEGFD